METLTAKPPVKREEEATDLSVFVRTSTDDIVAWDRDRIIDALIRETELKPEIALIIAIEVEKQIKAMAVKTITAPLIRELVDVKLLEYGLEEARRKHTRLGVPVYDVKKIIFHKNKENANTPHSPEATNLTLAENIKKEFALLNVFSLPVADAHMRGDIHLHDLGFADRPYCSGQSIEFVKKFGLDLPDARGMEKPAREPDELISQVVKYSIALHGHFAGAIGWDAVNIFIAPFIVGLGPERIRKLARQLILEFSTAAVARGGQGLFSDLNIYWEIPKHFETVPAMGPGGEYTGKTYGDYVAEAQAFANAMFEVYLEGDGAGRPFFFPKPLVHMTEKFFNTPGHEEFLELISKVAAEKGTTYFVFDRGETAKISECCRLSFKLDYSDLQDAREPWRMRYSAIQNVTLNLPRLAYLAARDEKKLFEEIEKKLEIAAQAHREKRRFIEALLKEGSNGPLSLLAMKRDGEAYLRLRRVTHLIGVLGLNELVQFHFGKELHEDPQAVRFGLKVISFMKFKCEQLSEKYDLHFVLEQTPAESTAYRFARLDLQQFPTQATSVIKGNYEGSEIYYTNSTYINVSHKMSPIDRVKQEGLFHPLIDAGALTHIWLGESRPDAKSIANFVIKTFKNTDNAQIAFSPEFTACDDCGKVTRGLVERCPHCSSANIEGITRITGYFSRVPGWNKGKMGELKDRFRSADLSGVL
ncbi:anaerobic ribonucleoside-triphosphate reductase [candidate division WOR-1 bacterium RIFOXYA12_FULL_52_29]|uniref:Anaerobic ribonucleoside-triphosphate reductase n=1 Tax=candidate division WOR-1 bacterium RIFOXYC12_FULL_54_18 TaxID=1802584 RepID=A0A1F4T6E7_UNCSA|nr:MAG: anaerobic ribonucleoside-triphosphate reductase [candidate division WOR-1 bacterium RIFOXYA2_FULL_51_19]OGC17881.1 MAG: anaerobic ribonucleoside-triphosphate reductase [candidate division WOR-1 bacterium RIFOXYA12_FULL_52_29]OGC26737.1 MAG: anaerobic ribonucleoside-triphosphate reductase [candidate division WOR-1 bacterium RIFOXYB2_FULL_45_9]OGC28298.1 MAG: anaerobic ribonucleoside-triphosphate reductase [candidate division WOR-1 bacterium RIFOXYC12_FULL_54_18]OGC31245.1 MAG: anaerobic 